MTKEQKFEVHLHHEDGTLWAEIPALPGCFATGDTPEELRESLEEAISLYLSGSAVVLTPRAVVVLA